MGKSPPTLSFFSPSEKYSPRGSPRGSSQGPPPSPHTHQISLTDTFVGSGVAQLEVILTMRALKLMTGMLWEDATAMQRYW